MALTDRKKTIAIVASILVIGVVIASAIAVSFSLIAAKQTSKTTTLYEPTAESLANTPLIMETKFLDNGEEAESGHYTFVLEDTDLSTFAAVQAEIQKKSSSRWEITGNYSAIGIFSVKMDESSLKAIALPLEAVQKHVLYVEPVYTVKLARATTLWGLDRLDQTNLPIDGQYNVPKNYNGAGVNVYVLDTGIRATHVEIAARVKTGYDTIGDGQGTNDCHGHGTHVSGTIGGTTYGVANGVNLYPVRVLNCQGSGTGQQVLNGINWVTANAIKPAVASMSLGGGYYAAENTAVERAISSGVTFVVAAGNDNADASNTSPASTPNAITVGATTSTDARASYSNYGAILDIFAPGSGITSCGISSDTASATMSGTSMATPHVSGVAALFLQSSPSATPAQVVSALTNGAKMGKVTDTQNSVNKLLDVQFLSGAASSASSSAATSAARSSSAASSAAPIATSAPVVPNNPTQVTETGSLSGRGALRYHPGNTGFTTTSTKTLTATLTGPTSSSVDFDLALLKFNASRGTWTVVASSSRARSSESISTSQSAGTYVWRVSAYAGSGSYSITYTRA